MAVPPWTRELLGADTMRQLQTRANELLGELPVTAARGLERVVRESRRGAEHLRRWVRRQTSISTEAVNGSGIFFHPEISPPLGAAQIDALVPMEDGFTAVAGASRDRVLGRLRSLVQRRVGHDVLVARSFSAAVAAAASAVGPSAPIVVPRGAAFRVDDGPTLPDLLASSGTRVIEVGSLDQCQREDWMRAGSGEWVACGVRWPLAIAGTHASGLENCPNDAPGVRKIQVVPYGVLDAAPSAPDEAPDLPADALVRIHRESVAEHWLTIVPGDRFLGGPMSGLILGSEEALRQVASTALWPALRADLGTLAALCVTLESAGTEDAQGSVLRSLLAASVENLRSRCDRLATQLAGESKVAACQVTDAPARLSRDLVTEIPSHQLRITPATGGGARWAARLAADVPSVLVQVDGEAIVLDLRWVPASLDGHLVAWLTGGSDAANDA